MLAPDPSYWLIPQGPEFQAVRRGVALGRSANSPQLIPIPLGSRPLDRWLPQLKAPPGSMVLLLGLAGSLNARFSIADAIVTSKIQTPQRQTYTCNPVVLKQLHTWLPDAQISQALSSDRIFTQVAEKQEMGTTYGCDLVEMEGAIVAAALEEKGLHWGMVRVISDDLSRNIPDLSNALLPEEGIDGLAMTAAFLQSPLQAFHFIRGSLRAISRLETIAQQLATASANF